MIIRRFRKYLRQKRFKSQFRKDKRLILPHFDAAYYLEANPDVAQKGFNPLHHFLNHGWKEGRNPTREFDVNSYFAKFPDIKRLQINPFVHYIRHGISEQRAITPLLFSELSSDEIEIIQKGFDEEFYLDTYEDLGGSRGTPLEHFCNFGWKEYRNPNPSFNTAYYLYLFPELLKQNKNPLLHFLSEPAKATDSQKETTKKDRLAKEVSKDFDAYFYRTVYFDIRNADINPLTHFLEYGANELRDPSPHFSSPLYCFHHAQVIPDGTSPYFHYVLEGKKADLETYESLATRFHSLSNEPSRYQFFQEVYEPIIKRKIEDELNSIEEDRLPYITIVTPAYNTRSDLFDQLLNSINKQCYQKWEWIIVDDCSPDRNTTQHIENAVANHPSITLIKSEVNEHISAATNKGIREAKGEIITFVDHDDLLSEMALAAVALASHTHPEAKWFYSDEDFIAPDDSRHSPHLKSAFNPELLKTHNYITHLSAVKTQTLSKVGLLDSLCDGAQDYDLHLRLAQFLKANEIIHIPLVLYHWRQIEGSTALGSDEKSYTHDAGLNALKKISKFSHHPFTPSDLYSDNYYGGKEKASYSLVSIIIPFKDHVQLLKNCIKSTTKTAEAPHEFILVDNGSKEQDTLNYLSKIQVKNDHITVVRDDKDFNFSRLINTGAKAANGDILLLLNNDIEAIDPGWVNEMATLAAQPNNGAVGCKLVYTDGTLQHTGIGLGLGGYAAHTYRAQAGNCVGRFGRLKNIANVAAVSAAALAVRKEVFWEVGGLDEDFQVGYNDVDFNIKLLESGYWNLCTYKTSLIHFESKTRGDDSMSEEKKRRFQKEKDLLAKKWPEYLRDDPFYHPLLTYSREDASFADINEFEKINSLIKGRSLPHSSHALKNVN